MQRLVWTLVCLTLAATSVVAQETRRYSVLIMEKPAGVQTSRLTADGVHELGFEFNDRGRGPRLSSRIRLDASGALASLETEGVDYFKAPVKETFSIVDGHARWQSTAEHGERRLEGRAFYLSMQGSPEELGFLAQALLKSPNGKLALLPAGEASIRRTDDVVLSKGGATQRVTAYEITGLGFTPTVVWLDAENRYFAQVSSWTSFVLEGWESSTAELLARQDAVEALRINELARTLWRTPSQPLAIVNANLFDSTTGRSHPGSTVVIEGDRIVAVGAAR